MRSQVGTYGFPKKWSVLCGIVLFILVGQSGGDAATPSSFPVPSLKLTVENHHISAQIHHMSLQAVLSALSAQLPIKFFLQGVDQDVIISTSFKNLPFEQGLDRLLVGYDYAIIHASIDTSDQTVDSRPIREVMILSRNLQTDSTFSRVPPLIIAPNVFGQSPVERLQEGQQAEDHSRSFDTTNKIDEQELIPLLEQALGESDSETPQLVQEILNRFELGNE